MRALVAMRSIFIPPYSTPPPLPLLFALPFPCLPCRISNNDKTAGKRRNDDERRRQQQTVVRIMSGFLAASGLRVLAFTIDIRLPTWTQPSPAAVNEELLEEMEAESEAKKIHIGGPP